jgi:hypothetical protein
MGELVRTPSVVEVRPNAITYLAAICTYSSGLVALIGITAMIIYYTIGGIWTLLPDVSVTVQYVLMLPIALEVHRLVRHSNPFRSQVLLVTGCVGMLIVITLQSLLLAGVLYLPEQLYMVTPAFMVVVVWFCLTGRLGRKTGHLPQGLVLHILAGLFFGYPVWAFIFGRQLMRRLQPTDGGVGS